MALGRGRGGLSGGRARCPPACAVLTGGSPGRPRNAHTEHVSAQGAASGPAPPSLPRTAFAEPRPDPKDRWGTEKQSQGQCRDTS